MGRASFFLFFFLEGFFLMIPLALSLSIRPFLASRLTISFSVFLCSFFFLRVVSLPTSFSMWAVDYFDSTPPFATLEPRLAYGLGVVDFPVFLFLVIGSLFEHRSTASSFAHIRPPIGGAVRTPPSRNRTNKTCVL